MSRPESSCEINPAKRLAEDDINYFFISIASLYDAYFSVLSPTLTACFLLNALIINLSTRSSPNTANICSYK